MPPQRDPFQDPEIARARKRRALLQLYAAYDRKAPQFQSGVHRYNIPNMKVTPTRRRAS